VANSGIASDERLADTDGLQAVTGGGQSLRPRTNEEAIRQARRDAKEARKRYITEDLYPVDMVDVVQNANLRLMVASIDDPNFVGYYERGTGTIYVNALSAPPRLRTTMAHEFGHWYDLEVKGRPATSCKREVRREFTSPGDAYADEFMLCFLMPEGLIRKLRKFGATIGRLSDDFGVSEESVMNRLRSLGLLS